MKWVYIRDESNNPIGEMFLTQKDEVTFKLNNSARKSKSYTGKFYIGNVQNKTQLFSVDGRRVSEEQAKKYYWGVVQDPSIFYDKQNPQNKNVIKQVKYLSSFYNANLDRTCKVSLQAQASINYNDSKIMENMTHANKYVIEDDEDDNYLLYELVINAGQYSNITSFKDYLSETIELYHGNGQASFAQDIEVYVGDPTASCTVDKNTMKQIYPNRQVSSPQIQINGRAINLKDPNSKTKSRSQVLEKYEITFKSPDLRNRTLLIRMKARKIAERNLSNYINYRYNGNKYSYNRVEVVATNGRKYGYQNAYATAPADAGGGIISPGTGERGNFRFRKVYKANNVTKPISNNPAIFEIKDSNDKSLGKVKTDKDGYAFFDNLEKGKTYYIKEISPPKGYIQDYTNYKVTVSKTNVNDIRMTVAGKDVSISYDKPYDFVNQRLYPLRIKKLDNNSKKSLSGAVFRLRNKDADTPIYNMTLGKGQSISEFTFNGLAKGSYILEEVEAPKGYKKIAPMEVKFDVAKGTALVNQSDPYGASSKIHENPVNGA